MPDKLQAAEGIVERLRACGYEAYFAGGCVRDLLLGQTPKDFDVATNARPEVVLEMFERTFAVGAHFGVVLVPSESPAESQPSPEVHSESSEEGLTQVSAAKPFVTEIATYRSDGAYSDGRRPDCVRFSESAEEDVARRDFTINGMLLDPTKWRATGDVAGSVLDFVGGQADLAAGLVRAIGDPRLRFEEDKLRMLRGVRFAARFQFKIEAKTKAAMRALAGEIGQVSRERLRDELTRMLCEGQARRAFELLDDTGLLDQVLPEIMRMKGVEQPPQFHPEGDVWIHTLLLLEKLEPGCEPTLAWAALLHDVGKPATFRRAPDRIRFDGHVDVGVAIAREICNRLRFSNEEAAQIIALVENHMKFGDIEKMRTSTLKRFFRLPRFDQHLALHRMDCLSSHGGLDLYEFAKRNYQAMTREAVRPKLLVTGRDLIAADYKPGPGFKQLLHAAEDAQLEGRIHTTEEGLRLLRELFPGA